MNSLKQLILISLLIQFSLSDLCMDTQFDELESNIHQEFQVSPGFEVCLKYPLTDTKSKISLMFFGSDSHTSEVVIYKSLSDISMKGDNYQDFEERFLIHENAFREIDVKEYEDYAYIIIRDPKDEDTDQGTLILYDSEKSIPLINGEPLNMKRFMDGVSYNFVYSSRNNLTFVYSSKVKSKKYLTIKYDGDTKVSRTLYATDEILYIINPEQTEKELEVEVEEIEPGKENEDFSVIVYENGPGEFIEIPKNEEKIISYINLDKKDEKQSFFFYYKLGEEYESNTINFKLDPVANDTKYINISAGQYHSSKSLSKYEMETNFHFDKNSLPVEYDRNSKIYKRIYFKDDDKSFQYRYIFFKVEISKLNEYYGSKEFIITIGDELEVIDLRKINYYTAHLIDFEAEALFPKYYKLLLDPEEEYIFTSPVPKSSMFLEGDLINKNTTTRVISVNHNYQDDPDKILFLIDYSEFTIRIFDDELIRKKIFIEKFKADEVLFNEFSRGEYPIDLEMSLDDCKYRRKKYIVGIYNETLYPAEDETVVSRYWTTIKEGEMTLYYRDNILLEGDSLFPEDKEYVVEKDKVFYLDNYIDFFTIVCNKPGIFSLRPLHKEYDEPTHTITQNAIDDIYIGNETEVIILSSPIKPTTQYLYFSIFSLDGVPVTIEPDILGMFNTTTIQGDELFKLKINLSEYKSDELAVLVNASESTRIEVLEVMHYNFTEYTVINKNGKFKLTDNHFIKYFDKNVDQVKVKISGLKGVPAAFGLVKLSTDDIDYLPLAYQFKEEYNITKKNIFENEEIILKNPFKDLKDNKKYLAFIFSLQKYNYYEYNIEIDEINEKGNNMILIYILEILGAILFIALIIFIIMYFVKKNRGGGTTHEGKFEEIDDDGNRHPLSPDQE